MLLTERHIGSTGSTASAAPDRVYAGLRERILNFELPPGTALSRNEIAANYNVSQAPVREALQALEEDGLVVIVPQSRTTVSKIDVVQLFETCKPFISRNGAVYRIRAVTFRANYSHPECSESFVSRWNIGFLEFFVSATTDHR